MNVFNNNVIRHRQIYMGKVPYGLYIIFYKSFGNIYSACLGDSQNRNVDIICGNETLKFFHRTY